MAKAKKNTNDTEEKGEELEDLSIVDDPSSSNVEEDEQNVEVSLDDIPLEEFMKDPEKAAKYTDDADVEETTAYCPQCSDHTIFVNGVCTNCGFAKTTKKNKEDEDNDEESSAFELMPEEDLGISYDFGENEESYD
jgi:hypothetical protein